MPVSTGRSRRVERAGVGQGSRRSATNAVVSITSWFGRRVETIVGAMVEDVIARAMRRAAH